MRHPRTTGSRLTMKKTLSTALLLSLLIACSNDTNEKSVSRSEFGDRWPLSVEEGTVKCLSNGAVIFVAAGREYGVNGFAKSRGYQAIDIIWAKDFARYDKMADEIAAGTKTPLSEVKESLGPVFRKDIGPVLDLGLSLCDR